MTSSPPPRSAPPALAFDDFDLVRPLGHGGMGHVWLGHDRALDRPVAIKFVADDHVAPKYRERFLREARALARLSHPNVVAVYRVGDVRGAPYIAYEFVPGRSLDRVSRPLSWSAALSLAVGMARGLEAAHASGILHRDIKPGNAVLSDAGVVKLLDFGLAKLVGDGPPSSGRRSAPHALREGGATDPAAPTEMVTVASAEPDPECTWSSTDLTQPGKLMGTPAYMAPELWRGEPASAQSDIFALGLVILELLVGRLPHAGRSWEEMGRKLLRDDIPPLRLARPDVPSELATAIDRCVRRDAADRPASVTDLRSMLKDVLRIAVPLAGRSASVVDASVLGRSPAGREEERLVQTARDRPEPRRETPRVSTPPAGLPITRYATRGEVGLAYQVFGSGPRELVVLPGWPSHAEIAWQDPRSARLLTELGQLGRVVVVDERGWGLSDRPWSPCSPEDRVDDLLAVLDAAGISRPVVLGLGEGAMTATTLAVLAPERVAGLVLHGPHDHLLTAAEDRGASTPSLEARLGRLRERWGQPEGTSDDAPSLASDDEFHAWRGRMARSSATPSAAVAQLRVVADLDLGPLGAAVLAPTLVVRRHGDRVVPARAVHLLAHQIPGARLVELTGADHLAYAGNLDAWIATIATFLRDLPVPTAAPSAALAIELSVHGGATRSFARAEEAISTARAILTCDPEARVAVAAAPAVAVGDRSAAARAHAMARTAPAGAGRACSLVRQLSLGIEPALQLAEDDTFAL